MSAASRSRSFGRPAVRSRPSDSTSNGPSSRNSTIGSILARNPHDASALPARYRRVGARSHRVTMAQPRLSEAEARVLRLAAGGLRSGEIAEALHLSRAAVAWHLAQSYTKLGLGRDAA